MGAVLRLLLAVGAALAVPGAAAAPPTDDGDVYSIRLDGTGRRNLTRSLPGFDFAPAPAPDGRRIAFVSLRSGRPQIDVVRADGSGLRPLVPSSLPNGAAPADPDTAQLVWSPDGRRLAFNAEGGVGPCLECPRWSVYTVRADGADLRLLARGARNPAWSPDGRRLVLERIAPRVNQPYALAIVNADGTQLRTISASSGALHRGPVWSRRGVIAFTLAEFSNRRFDETVALVRSGGGRVRKLASGSQPAWSPDGSRLAFVSRPPRLTIAVLNLRKGARVGIGRGSGPRWSPSGAWLAWVDRRDQIAAAAPDGSRKRAVTHESLRLSGGPAWARGGRLVYSLRPD